MPTRKPIELGEWYHCYNRGVDKRAVYLDAADYQRFLLGMYTCAGDKAVQTSNLKDKRLPALLGDSGFDRGADIVEIGAYCLMPNHFHFVVKEIVEGGVARFMQKLCTGYTMYFNTRHERTGALFAGTFKSKHVEDDRYLKHLIAYVHLNPAELFDGRWKQGHADLEQVQRGIKRYGYSSLPDHLGVSRPERQLLGSSVFEIYDRKPTLQEMVADAHDYYLEYRG
ncbi:MAG TPA: transposase [Candidatus Paceibacterota bacterium]|nr:transposase [Candidatus Paceibacterota bacterium]